ncbi:hypothetical protein BH10PSE14_BH10PSE14_40480 [soil metagenome]
MNDMSPDTGSAGSYGNSVTDLSHEPDGDYYVRQAAKARELAARATAAGARSLHLEMAADYDRRAAQAPAP